jgi:hypothetical protein
MLKDYDMDDVHEIRKTDAIEIDKLLDLVPSAIVDGLDSGNCTTCQKA